MPNMVCLLLLRMMEVSRSGIFRKNNQFVKSKYPIERSNKCIGTQERSFCSLSETKGWKTVILHVFTQLATE
jgi:hypothetical protein